VDVDQQAIADQESGAGQRGIGSGRTFDDDRLKDVVGTPAAKRAADEAPDLVGVKWVQSIPSASAQ
jgi:hypothetical protein